MALEQRDGVTDIGRSSAPGSITELAAAEKIDRSYICRVLRLTLLAPEIVEAIIDGRQPEEVTLPALMKGFSVEWERQGIWRAT